MADEVPVRKSPRKAGTEHDSRRVGEEDVPRRVGMDRCSRRVGPVSEERHPREGPNTDH